MSTIVEIVIAHTLCHSFICRRWSSWSWSCEVVIVDEPFVLSYSARKSGLSAIVRSWQRAGQCSLELVLPRAFAPRRSTGVDAAAAASASAFIVASSHRIFHLIHDPPKHHCALSPRHRLLCRQKARLLPRLANSQHPLPQKQGDGFHRRVAQEPLLHPLRDCDNDDVTTSALGDDITSRRQSSQ